MMSRVYTAESSIQGTGVFSSAHFSPGEIILRIDDSRVVTDADPLDPAKGQFEHHCDYLSGGKVVLMQPPERFINHRCDPNSYVRTITGDRFVVALREIRAGDEITYDYCVNGDGDTAWDCSCKSPACRRQHLSGFFHLPLYLQSRYLALLEGWFVAEHRDEVEILKRQNENGHAAKPLLRGSPPLEAGLPHEDGKPVTRGVVLVVNPPLHVHEIATLFEVAWGALAPGSPPAIDRCLAHICAYHDGRLVGFIKLAWDGGIHAFVLDTTVHPDHQRRGIGRWLVERAAEVAGRSGVEWLHVDYEPTLAGFYARCGFRPTPAGLMRAGGDGGV
jgi:GNAT superfamily N-acetyltransferase